MNALEKYFKKTGTNLTALAEKIGVAFSTLSRPLKGQRMTRTDLALEVEKATDGAVTAEQFLAICLDARRKALTAEEDVA